MRSTTLVLTLFLCAHLSQAQNLPNGFQNFQTSMSTEVCPYDDSQSVVWPEGWSVYQTQNDLWDGPVDSSQCLTFVQMDDDWVLDLATIHAQRPVFIRYNVVEGATPVPANAVYQTFGNYWTDATPILADTCNELCSGMFLQYTLPFDEDSTVVRTVREVLGEYKDLSGCWSTERSEEMFLKEFIMKYTFEETDLTGLTFKPWSFYAEDVSWAASEVLAFVFEEWMAENDTTYRGYLHSIAFPNGFGLITYVPQLVEGFPSFEHYTYVEAIPDFPATEQLDLIITFDFEDELLFQPFTGVRGGLVDGSDTLRHNLTLDFYEADICQKAFIVDVVVPDNTRLLMGDGSWEFGNGRSCFMFQDGGQMAIKADASFTYGYGGIGVLGLARNGHLKLEPNSTLTVNNRMMLVDYSTSTWEQAYVDLAPGSTLRFGETSSLSRSFGDNMYLNVYMNGGTIDDSELSPEERQLIRRIYPEVPMPASGTAKVAPNPSSGEVMLVLEDQSMTPWPFQLVNALGQVVNEGKLEALAEGRYRIQPTADLPNGLYRVFIQTNDGPVVASWVYER